MKYLEKHQIDQVNSKFRQMVLDAWKQGENVPESVIYLSDRKPTVAEIKRFKKLVKDGIILDE